MATPASNSSIVRRARVMGATAAALTVAGIGLTFLKVVGEPSPPALSVSRFSVAVLAGPRQAEQNAPENVENTADTVVTAPTDTNKVVEADRSSSLPEAVAATVDAQPSVAAPKPAEVIPPAQVSMPGGKLAATDAPRGSELDPFAIGPSQVYIRLLVNESGKVVRGGIVRSGREPLRDTLIYKAMSSRTFDPKSMQNPIRMPGDEPLWQVDLVIDYTTNDFLP